MALLIAGALPAQAQGEIAIPDPNLEWVLRAEDVILGKSAIATSQISREDLESIINLNGAGKSISYLAGLEYCINLESLYMRYNNIDDIAPLKGLNKLRCLYLAENQISDICPLSGLLHLEELSLSDNSVSDVNSLMNLKSLKWLYLDSNEIVDISVLADLLNLQLVDLKNNHISSISPLVHNPGIGRGDLLVLGSNPLDNEAYEKNIPELERRGVKVFSDRTRVRSTIPPFHIWLIVILVGLAVLITTQTRRKTNSKRRDISTINLIN